MSAITIEEKIKCLADISRDNLVKRWIKAHGNSPPKGVKRSLLERSSAYQLQVKALSH